jgi:hypothetical protein
MRLLGIIKVSVFSEKAMEGVYECRPVEGTSSSSEGKIPE